jgi:hypothetical protein
MRQTDTWASVSSAVETIAVPVGRQRGTPILAARADERLDGAARFVVVADRGAFVMSRRPTHRAVDCHWELSNGVAWWGHYRIDDDGSWTGPFAPGAESRRMTDPNDIARDLIDGWLMAVIPHH